MNSNKSRPTPPRPAVTPQRSHGKLRHAALLAAGSAVIAEKGFQAATMAEIAARAGAPIGSLYRFFPSKEILADALVQRLAERFKEAFEAINRRIETLSLPALVDALLSVMTDLQDERMAIRALLEAHADWSERRIEFRAGARRQIAKTLTLRAPNLTAKSAKSMAVVILQNMKMVGVLNQELRGEDLAGAQAELQEMTRLYLQARLGK